MGNTCKKEINQEFIKVKVLDIKCLVDGINNEFLEEIPYLSNYTVTTYKFNRMAIKSVGEISDIFHRSTITIRSHINLNGLNCECQIGLTHEQYNNLIKVTQFS